MKGFEWMYNYGSKEMVWNVMAKCNPAVILLGIFLSLSGVFLVFCNDSIEHLAMFPEHRHTMSDCKIQAVNNNLEDGASETNKYIMIYNDIQQTSTFTLVCYINDQSITHWAGYFNFDTFFSSVHFHDRRRSILICPGVGQMTPNQESICASSVLNSSAELRV